MTSPSGTPTPAELAFKWVGGTASVNFTATVGQRLRNAFERLREPGDLSRWFREAGLSDALVEVSEEEWAEARVLREVLYRLFTAADAELDVVNRWTSRPLAGASLELVDGGFRLSRPAADVRDLLSLLARDAVDLLCGPLANRIRTCASDDCSLLFVDESRAGARRWCSMNACGARSKMSHYRARLPK